MFCKDWPTQIGDLKVVDDELAFKPSKHGNLEIYRMPEKGADYCIAVDVAEGLVEGDYSVVTVWRGVEQAAEWHGHIDPYELADISANLGYFYNEALLAVEDNDMGSVTATRLFRDLYYPNLYYRENRATADDKVSTKRVGWHTSGTNKGDMVSELALHIKNWERTGFTPHSVRLVNECRTFAVHIDKRGFDRYAAQSGCRHLSDSDEEAINKQLDRMHAAAVADKEKVTGSGCRRWKHYTNFALGNQWEGYDGNLPVLYTDNRIGRNLRIKADLVNEMHIGAEFEAREPGDEVAAALQNAVKDYYWESLGVPETLDRVGMMADRLGTGIVKVHWDPKANEGLGDARVDWWPSKNLLTEPGKVKFDDMRWMCATSWIDPKECETKYGGVPRDIGARDENIDMGDLEDTTNQTEGTMYNVSNYGEALQTTTTGKVPADSFFSSDADAKKVLKEEWWIRDDAIEVTEGDEGKKAKKKKYPKGRLIIRLGRQIVEDKKNPYDHGKWPYAHDIDELDPKRFWGDTSIRHSIPVQKEHNVTFSRSW